MYKRKDRVLIKSTMIMKRLTGINFSQSMNLVRKRKNKVWLKTQMVISIYEARMKTKRVMSKNMCLSGLNINL